MRCIGDLQVVKIIPIRAAELWPAPASEAARAVNACIAGPFTLRLKAGILALNHAGGCVIKVVFWLVLLQIACVPIADAAEDGALVIGTTRTVRSELLGEDRALQIYLPQSYESSRRYRRYPVLYIRDGAKFFHSFTGVVAQLTSDATPRAPEMIVVVGHAQIPERPAVHGQ